MNARNTQRQTLMSYAILTTAVAALLFMALATPVRARTAFYRASESQQTTYEKSLEALARSEAVSAEFEQRSAASDPTTQIFRADTPALAGADLQNQLNSLIAAEGGMVTSSAFREPLESDPLTPVAVTARLRCSMEALVRILHGIENRSPILFVETLVVQSNLRSGQAFRPGDGDLEVELEVVGFLDKPPVE
jgi:general secretion pathway protein M